MPLTFQNKKPYTAFIPHGVTLNSYLKHNTYGIWCFSQESLRDFVIRSQMVGRGGFADIYVVTHSSGNPFVCKLYNRKEQRPPGEILDHPYYHILRANIMRSVHFTRVATSERSKLSGKSCPFILPVLGGGDNNHCNWFIMPRAQGQTVQRLINQHTL